MIRKILICVITAFGSLTGLAQAMDAPATQTPPQVDEATFRMVWRSVDSSFPELMEGPEKDGIFLVVIAIRPDGAVVQSDMRYADSRAQGAPFVQQLRNLLPGDGKAIPVAANYRKGSAVMSGRALKGEVYLNAVMVPANWEAARDRNIIRRAVLDEHLDLFVPMSEGHLNQLTVVMNEKGQIEASRVDQLPIERQGEQVVIRTRRVAATDFAALGRNADQVGIIGEFALQKPAPAQQAAGSTTTDPPQLRVRFAWPRRNGEPAGVDPYSQPSIAQQGKPSPQMQKIMDLVEQYFPAATNTTDGNWILLDSRGEFLRTGRAEVIKDEPLMSRMTGGYLERQFPGIKVATMTGISRSPPPQKPGDPPGSSVTVMVYTLAAGSPLPPAENAAPQKP